MNAPSIDIKDILVAEGIGTFGNTTAWSISVNTEPKYKEVSGVVVSPNDSITIYDTGGSLDYYLLNSVNPVINNTFQLRVRDIAQLSGYTKINTISQLLDRYSKYVATDDLTYKGEVQAATISVLPANTYDNGTLGVGATITGDANGALTAQDGISLSNGDKLLVKNETSTEAPNNGIYTVTQIGTAGTPFILTRATNNDEADEFIDTYVTIAAGTTLIGKVYECTNSSAITVGTTDITHGEFAGGTNDVTYSSFHRTTDIINLRQDDNNRYIWVVNYRTTRHQSNS